jgi:hypothetical protein
MQALVFRSGWWKATEARLLHFHKSLDRGLGIDQSHGALGEDREYTLQEQSMQWVGLTCGEW